MKYLIYLLSLSLFFHCKTHGQEINHQYFRGSWVASQAVMFTTLDVSESIIFVGNRADTIFTIKYSISHDTLITYAPFTNQQFKNKIILLTKDTLVLNGIMNVTEVRHYSRAVANKEVQLLNAAVLGLVIDANKKRQQGDFKGALAYYDVAVELNPKNSEVYCRRGLLKVELIDDQGAIADFTKAIELDPKNAEAYFSRALSRTRNDNRAAASDYTDAIRINPKNHAAYYNRALINETIGDLHAALSDFSKAIELDPKHGMSYFNRGDVKDSLRDYRGAVDDYTKALENDPKLEEGFFIRDSHLKRGRARYKAADYRGAIEDFTFLLKDENLAEAHYWRGMAKVSLKQIEGGCADLSKADQLGFAKARGEIKKNCR